MRIKKLTCASWIGLASVFTLVAQGADTVVTNNWNVTPWNVGPALETFEAVPSWATGQENITGLANRTDRFWKTEYVAGNQLKFVTLGITNTISGATIQAGMPIFIDMRCKMNPFDTTPPQMEPNTLLCFYANESSNLVVASSSQSKTNTNITVLPSEYYPIMIRFAVDTFDVFFNNATETATLSLPATTNVISKMVISGTGEMDDLYISYGDPRRAAGYVADVPTPFATPTNEIELVINNWVASQTATNTALVGKTITVENAEKYYLTDSALSDAPFAGELGIGSFSYNPILSNVTVVVTLKTDASTPKTGKINGKLQLKGAGDYHAAKNGGWSSSLGTTTMSTNDFASGSATYTFKLIGDANTNKFFLPIIVSDIQ